MKSSSSIPCLLSIVILALSCAKDEEETLAPDTRWSRTFDYLGLGASDNAVAVVQTADESFVVAGTVFKSFVDGTRTVSFLTKFDPAGNILWTKEYGESTGSYFRAAALAKSNDNGLLLAGTTGTLSGEQDFFAMETDSAGNVIWMHNYGGADGQQCLAAISTSDNGFLLAGNTRQGGGPFDGYLVKIGDSGIQEWTREYGGAMNDEFRSVCENQDGGFIAAGETYSFGPGTPSDTRNNMYVVRTNSEGDSIWTRAIGSELWEAANSVATTSDSGCVVVGLTNQISYYQWYGYLVRMAGNGEVEWTQAYGSPNVEYSIIYSVISVSGNKYVYAGEGQGRTESDVHVAEIDITGGTIWDGFYGENGAAERGLCIIQATDGGFVVCGRSEPDFFSPSDSYIVRF